MTNKPRNIGTRWETAIVRWFLSLGGIFSGAHRNEFASPNGDIGGIEDATLEAKAARQSAWPDWLRQMEKEYKRTGNIPWLIRKRDRQPVGEALVTTKLSWWAKHWEEFLAYKHALAGTSVVPLGSVDTGSGSTGSTPAAGGLFGIPIVVDATLAPGVVRLLDAEGNAVAEWRPDA